MKIVVKKLHLHPLTSKPKPKDQRGRKIENQRFWCVCLGVNYSEKREKCSRKVLQRTQFFFFFLAIWEQGIYIFICDHSAFSMHKVCALEFRAHTKCVSVPRFSCHFNFWLRMLIWMPSKTLIEPILVALERSGCLVFRLTNFVKINGRP